MIRVLLLGKDFDLCEAHIFAGLARLGVEFDALLDAPRFNAGILEAEGISLEEIKFSGRLDVRSIITLYKKLRSRKYDIVHCLTSRALSNVLMASAGLRLKHVAYRGTMGHLGRFDPLSWLSFLNPRLDKIVCVSEAVRNYLLALVPERKLVTIYKGHNTEWYESDLRADIHAFGVPAGAFTVGCVANMRPVKGVPYLIDAIRKIPAERNVHLLLVGRIEDVEINRLLKDEWLRERVHCTGFQEKAVRLVAECDAFVMPSIKREGLPKALIEAMSVGVPPIVTRVGGMPEVIEDGKCGIVVPPADSDALASAVSALASNPEMADRYGRNAKERVVEHFNVSNTVQKTLALYNELVRS